MPSFQYRGHWTVTNGIAYNVGEALTWAPDGVGTFTSEIVAGGNAPYVDFFHVAGTAPSVGSVLLGATTGASRTIDDFVGVSSGVRIVPKNVPANPGIIGVEWTTDIRRYGDPTLPIGDFRVNFAFLRPIGGGTFTNAIASFAAVHYEPGDAGSSATEKGCLVGWSTQYDLTTITTFTKVFLWDDSAGVFIDMTTAASSSTASDVQMPEESVDFLYLGYSTVRNHPAIKYEMGSAATNGDPLIVEYSTGPGWSVATGVVDNTSAFGQSGQIDLARPDDWVPRDVNGSTLFWIRVSLTVDAAATGVGTRIRAHRDIDGTVLMADPDVPPRWAHHWLDIDVLGGTGAQMTARDSLNLPQVVKWRTTKIGSLTDVNGSLWRNSLNGQFRDLNDATDGNGYALWKLENEVFGMWRDVGVYYMPNAYVSTLNDECFALFTEWVTQYPTFPVLADSPVDVRYRGLRAYDGTRWIELTDWQVTTVHPSADPYGGWSVQQETGALASLADYTTVYREGTVDASINRWLFAGLEYRQSSGIALPTKGLSSGFTAGTITYNGPIWTNGTAAAPTNPIVLQEYNRGYIVMLPAAGAPISAVYTTPVAGTYTFDGDFARADNSVVGDGVTVTVMAAGNALHSATIPVTNAAAVNPDDIFATGGGTNLSSFLVTVALPAGAAVAFTVDALTGTSSDATAFRVGITYVETIEAPALTLISLGEAAHRIQSGIWNGTSWNNTSAATVTATTEYWSQWDVTGIDSVNQYLGASPDTTFQLVTSSAGEFELEFFAWVGPLTASFNTTFPPTNRDFRRVVERRIVKVLHDEGMTDVTLPLRNADGTMTPLGAALGADYHRSDSLGRRRFAFGVRVAPTSTETTLLATEVSILDVYVGDNFTGWGGMRGSTGDRAVRCPRCGHIGRELELVVDGVTRTKVCPDCYDPPTPPGNFRWPFRS